jgi:chromosome condensin MukBEF complex kleisin-like MukF subunit
VKPLKQTIMDFNTMVKKQEEIELLKKEKKALIERLESCNSVIEEASETIEEWFEDEKDRGDIYINLIAELAPNEELLIKIKH